MWKPEYLMLDLGFFRDPKVILLESECGKVARYHIIALWMAISGEAEAKLHTRYVKAVAYENGWELSDLERTITAALEVGLLSLDGEHLYNEKLSERIERGRQKSANAKRAGELRHRPKSISSASSEGKRETVQQPLSECSANAQQPLSVRHDHTHDHDPESDHETVTDTGSDPEIEVKSLLEEVHSRIASEDRCAANTYHDAFVAKLRADGLTVEKEHPVADVGTGSPGRIDLRFQLDGRWVYVELDRRTPRAKSLLKLAARKPDLGFCVLRDTGRVFSLTEFERGNLCGFPQAQSAEKSPPPGKKLYGYYQHVAMGDIEREAWEVNPGAEALKKAVDMLDARIEEAVTTGQDVAKWLERGRNPGPWFRRYGFTDALNELAKAKKARTPYGGKDPPPPKRTTHGTPTAVSSLVSKALAQVTK